jgi:c-di-GMP-binding flagellar brake protein YcgR
MVEKRRSERVKKENSITIAVRPEESPLPASKICHALSKDISLYGLRIRCPVFFPVDECLKLQISFDHPSQIVHAHGKVCWVKDMPHMGYYEVGLAFVDLSAENQRILKDRIEALKESIPSDKAGRLQ